MATSWRASIKHWLDKGESPENVVSRVYETYPARAFEKIHNYDLEYSIKRSVSDELAIPITSILIAGSAQLGESVHSSKIFNPETSDLDLAIIDKDYYLKLGNLVQRNTMDFQDLTKFPTLEGIPDVPQLYKDNYCKGFIHVFMLPSSDEKRKIRTLFNALTKAHHDKFKDISGSFYSSLQSFEKKQSHLIRMVK
jgi:hypothetical protein